MKLRYLIKKKLYDIEIFYDIIYVVLKRLALPIFVYEVNYFKLLNFLTTIFYETILRTIATGSV